MIKIIMQVVTAIIVTITSLLFSSCNFNIGKDGLNGTNGFGSIKGSGNVVVENRNVESDFNSIVASSGLEIVIEQGNNKSVIVEADDNILKHIMTQVNNGELKIFIDTSIRNASSKKVIVSLQDIENLTTSSGASINSKNILKGNTINLTSSSGSSINVSLDTESTSCTSSSGSEINIQGKTEILETKSSSGSAINAKKLIAKSVVSVSSSGSSTYVNPTESLSAKASSGSSINYNKTAANITRSSSSGASISAN